MFSRYVLHNEINVQKKNLAFKQNLTKIHFLLADFILQKKKINFFSL